MPAPLRLGLAGLGTVGIGVVGIVQRHADLIAVRTGRAVVITAVSARDQTKNRDADLSGYAWEADPVTLAKREDIDVFVEVIGGSEGPARDATMAAIASGKDVVTANKALLAHHGQSLAEAAEDRGRVIRFEAAVAGGIPVIKALTEGLAGNAMRRVMGVMNGTCNYILTQMRERGIEFTQALNEAQKLGYAEADPSFDVDGIDAAHKLDILAALAFGRPVDFAAVHVEGIRNISALDIKLAEELGYRIKLLGIARRTEAGIDTRMHPAMVPIAHPIARVDGVFNAVVAEGDFVGRIVLEGRGAGAGPTASAVVADLIDIARGRFTPVWGVAQSALSHAPSVPMERRVGAYYLRLMVVDRPGVIADVTATLRDNAISLESMLQRGRAPGEAVPVVVTTHDCEESQMRAALARIASLEAVVETPALIRIEAL